MPFFTDWTGHKMAFGIVSLAVQVAACDDVEIATDADDADATGDLESEVTLDRALELTGRICNGGWPGVRACWWWIDSPTDIVPGSIQVQINGHNGEVIHAAQQNGARQIKFVAVVHEGDVFGPGKNTTSYTVAWLRL